MQCIPVRFGGDIDKHSETLSEGATNDPRTDRNILVVERSHSRMNTAGDQWIVKRNDRDRSLPIVYVIDVIVVRNKYDGIGINPVDSHLYDASTPQRTNCTRDVSIVNEIMSFGMLPWCHVPPRSTGIVLLHFVHWKGGMDARIC